MKRTPLYSRDPGSGVDPRLGSDEPPAGSPGDPAAGAVGEAGQERDWGGHPRGWRGSSGRLAARNERAVFLASGAGIMLVLVLLLGVFRSPAAPLTQRDIDMAVLHTLEKLPASPSTESLAYQVIRPSVVRVQEMLDDEDDPGADGEPGAQPGPQAAPQPGPQAAPQPGPQSGPQVDPRQGTAPGLGIPPSEGFGGGNGTPPPAVRSRGLGTGVVVEENGTILTNLHVVMGVERIEVVFADGTRSPAEIIGIEPDMDLAVIRVTVLPDDLIPATLRSTRDLHLGDRVMAVGYPFGIGPSLSSGVVSGLRREFRSPEGEAVLTNLIQFDAAANPGNSGGPLVTEEGFVVGIVTAILNPNNQRSFVGIAFAVPIESAMQAVGNSPF